MKLFTSTRLASCVFVWLLQDPVFAAEESAWHKTSKNRDDRFLTEEFRSVFDASKYEQKVTQAPPASMGIVTADEIKKYGYRTFGDIISSLKGFYNTSDRMYGYIGARGFGIPSDYNTRLLLLIDGHRFNDNIYDSFDSSEGFPVDIDMIERVEVFRGPSSSLYGTSAFFGAINIITKRGRDLQSANVKTSYGSNDAYKTSVSYGGRLKNGLETFLSGTFYDSQGYKSLYYREFDNPATNNGIYRNNDEEQAKKLLATMTYQDFTVQGLYVRRNRDVPTGSFSSVFNDPSTQTTDESTYIDLKYNHTFANQVNLQSRVSYNNYRYRADFPYTNPAGGLQPLINKDLTRGQWWRAELNLTKVFWNRHRITAGSEFQHNFDQFQTNFDATTTYLNSQASTYRWALLIQDEYTISDNLTLNTGVRYDYFSIFGKTVNPRAGLIYQPWTNGTIKFLYGSAFRAPNQYEINYSTPFDFSPSVNLKPEKLETLEFIVEHSFNDHLRSELNLFQTEIKDIIALTRRDGLNQQNKNTGNVESRGLEVQLEDTWDNGFQGRLSYSWQETKYTNTGERLTNSPEHLIKLNIIIPLWFDKVFIGYETRYMSSRKTVSGGEVGDFVINNLTLFTQNWIKGLDLSASAYNLFDARYFDPGSDAHRQNGIRQDGLTFRVKASIDF